LEIGVIVLLVLIIFGAGKLPQVFRAAGRGIRDFRRAQAGEFDEEEEKKTLVKEPEKK
jgi:sec-independent protein translocase protein TatA